MDDEHPLVRDVYPDLTAELVNVLNAAGETDLGICTWDLRIFAPCACTDDFCQSFYTAPPPNGAYGPGHRNLMLSPAQGMTILDMVHSRIMFVELINHPPLLDARSTNSR